jgi:hypothetical protein
MRLFSVHAKSPLPERVKAEADEVRFVKEGFAWWGFFFPLPWLLVKGMWLVFALALAVAIAIVAGGDVFGVPELAMTALAFGINIIIGFMGNDLYRWTLRRRGLVDVGPAAGADREEAELRFFLSLPDIEAAPPPVSATLPAQSGYRDALGLFEPAGSPR